MFHEIDPFIIYVMISAGFSIWRVLLMPVISTTGVRDFTRRLILGVLCGTPCGVIAYWYGMANDWNEYEKMIGCAVSGFFGGDVLPSLIRASPNLVNLINGYLSKKYGNSNGDEYDE